jgi:hypothetical protein
MRRRAASGLSIHSTKSPPRFLRRTLQGAEDNCCKSVGETAAPPPKQRDRFPRLRADKRGPTGGRFGVRREMPIRARCDSRRL